MSLYCYVLQAPLRVEEYGVPILFVPTRQPAFALDHPRQELTMQDVEMKSTDEKKTEKKEEAPPPKPTLLQEIKGNVQLIERGVASMEPRFAHRVLRTLTALRKRLNADVLRAVIEDTIEGIDASSVVETCVLTMTHRHRRKEGPIDTLGQCSLNGRNGRRRCLAHKIVNERVRPTRDRRLPSVTRHSPLTRLTFRYSS